MNCQRNYASAMALRLLLLLLTLALFITLASGATTTVDYTTLQAFYTKLRTTDNAVFSGTVTTFDTTGKIFSSSVTMGAAQYTSNAPMTESTSFRVNQLSESLIATSVLSLVNGIIPFGLADPIPSSYLPNGVTDFYNPNYPLVKITLRMLLEHTSSLLEADFDTSYRSTVATGPVGGLTSFCQSFFTSPVGTGFGTKQTGIWSTTQPGLTSSYVYSRANTALLGCVLEAAIVATPTSVASVNKTAAAYIQEKILTPLGMSGSFLLSTSGSPPSQSNPYGTSPYGSASVQDVSSTGIADNEASFIHPAYVSDYMYFSTTSDWSKFIRSLFLSSASAPTAFQAVGAQQLAPSGGQPLGVASVSGVLNGVVGQGDGVRFFSGTKMCTAATSAGILTSCLLTSTSTIFGSVSLGTRSAVGWFCTTQVSSSNPTCVVVQLSYVNSLTATTSATRLSAIYGLAAVAFQASLGSTSIVTSGGGGSSTDPMYGFYVFLGVAGAFFFVFSSSYVAEYLIQPAPIVAAVPPHAMPIPASYYGEGAGGAGMGIGAAYSGGMGGGGGGIMPHSRGGFYDQ